MSAPALDVSLVPPAVRELARLDGKRLAAFDADGCLWGGDIFEDFTQSMIAQGAIDGAGWPAYEAQVKVDPLGACFTMLTFYKGMDHDVFCTHVERFWRDSGRRPWQESVTSSLRFLHEAGFTVWVVSGTATAVLAPLVRYLPVQRICGLEFEVDANNRITGDHRGIATAGPGKAEALRSLWRGDVHFAVGNSIIDLDMLRLAKEVAWAFRPDAALLAQAEAQGWLITPR